MAKSERKPRAASLRGQPCSAGQRGRRARPGPGTDPSRPLTAPHDPSRSLTPPAGGSPLGRPRFFSPARGDCSINPNKIKSVGGEPRTGAYQHRRAPPLRAPRRRIKQVFGGAGAEGPARPGPVRLGSLPPGPAGPAGKRRSGRSRGRSSPAASGIIHSRGGQREGAPPALSVQPVKSPFHPSTFSSFLKPELQRSSNAKMPRVVWIYCNNHLPYTFPVWKDKHSIQLFK